jgi:RNA polymerase sigma-70 factor (ECF subfamily)
MTGNQPNHRHRKHGPDELQDVLSIARQTAEAHGANRYEADEVAQITAVKLWTRWDHPNTAMARDAGPKPWRSYVRKVARNTYYDEIRSHLRRLDRNRKAFAHHHGVHAAPGSVVAVPVHPGGVAEMLAREVLADEIRRLPSPQCRVAGLAFLDELCPREIAERLGMNPQMVRRHLRAARNTLRPMFDEPAP